MEAKTLAENIIRLEKELNLVTAQRDALLNDKQAGFEDHTISNTEKIVKQDDLAMALAERDTLKQLLNEANIVIAGLAAKFILSESPQDRAVDSFQQYSPSGDDRCTIARGDDSGNDASDSQPLQEGRTSTPNSLASSDTSADGDELSTLAAGKAELAIRVAELESQKDALEARLTACMAENTVMRARLAVAAAKKRAANKAASFDLADMQSSQQGLLARNQMLAPQHSHLVAANIAATNSGMAVNPFAGVTKTDKLAFSNPFSGEQPKANSGTRSYRSTSSLNSRNFDAEAEEDAVNEDWEIQAAMLSPGLDRMSSFDSQSDPETPLAGEKDAEDETQQLLPTLSRRKTSEQEAMSASLQDIQRKLSQSKTYPAGDCGKRDVHKAGIDQGMENLSESFISCAASKADLDAELAGLRRHSEVLQAQMDHADSLMSDVVQQLEKVTSHVTSL